MVLAETVQRLGIVAPDIFQDGDFPACTDAMASSARQGRSILHRTHRQSPAFSGAGKCRTAICRRSSTGPIDMDFSEFGIWTPSPTISIYRRERSVTSEKEIAEAIVS